MSIRPLKWILLGPVLALLLLGHGLGAEWDVPPRGQPAQMWSRVNYNGTIADPFFLSDERGYSKWIDHPPYFKLEDLVSREKLRDPPLVQYTARCFSSSSGSKHPVGFCRAKLIDENLLVLLIHDSSPGFSDALEVQIKNGRFMCQFRHVYPRGRSDELTWTTTKQKLTLEKKDYRKGDVLKGRIDFTCLEQHPDPEIIQKCGRGKSTIRLYGVFKTIVQGTSESEP